MDYISVVPPFTVLRQQSHPMGPRELPRDYLVKEIIFQEGGASYVYASGLVASKQALNHPPLPGVQRGLLLYRFYKIEKVEGGT